MSLSWPGAVVVPIAWTILVINWACSINNLFVSMSAFNCLVCSDIGTVVDFLTGGCFETGGAPFERSHCWNLSDNCWSSLSILSCRFVCRIFAKSSSCSCEVSVGPKLLLSGEDSLVLSCLVVVVRGLFRVFLISAASCRILTKDGGSTCFSGMRKAVVLTK